MDLGPVLAGAIVGACGAAGGGIIGSFIGYSKPGQRWASIELPIAIDFKPGPPLPTVVAGTRWNLSGAPFIVMDDKWDIGIQESLSFRRGLRPHIEWGMIFSCDLWRPAKTAPEGSAVEWQTSGEALLFGVAPMIRFLATEPREGVPRLFLDGALGAQAIWSDAEILMLPYVPPPPPEKLMDAPFGMLADVGIGASYPMGGIEPELMVKLHSVFGKAENEATFMAQVGFTF